MKFCDRKVCFCGWVRSRKHSQGHHGGWRNRWSGRVNALGQQLNNSTLLGCVEAEELGFKFLNCHKNPIRLRQ